MIFPNAAGESFAYYRKYVGLAYVSERTSGRKSGGLTTAVVLSSIARGDVYACHPRGRTYGEYSAILAVSQDDVLGTKMRSAPRYLRAR